MPEPRPQRRPDPLATRALACALVVTGLALAGCSDDSSGDDGGGASGGGSPSGTPGAGGAPSGNGGSGSGASGGDSAGPGGSGGAGSSSGGAGGGGVVPSAGCGKADPASGDLTIDVAGQTGEYVVSIPADYDPTKPYPLGFAFHGFGRTGPNCQDGDCAGFQSTMENDAVLVYMTSHAGEGWDAFDAESTFFETVLDHMLEAYCIDEAHVFAAGTSSGAHFSNVLGCRYGDRLVAIAPVAGYLPQTEGCVDRVAALVIHGIDDGSFDAGVTARDFWRERNGCSEDTVPTIAEVHAGAEATPESHGCAVYQGCDAGLPVTWCEHSEGGYDGSTHGWPLFGGQQIWEFVSAL
jgi:polyhydroxybutyrate depolymerase